MIRAGCIAMALVPVMASAQNFDGIYRQAANSDCALIGVDGGAIEIRDGIFHGVESECRMTLPVQVVDMDAKLYTMQCTGGGEADADDTDAWSARAMIMTNAGNDGIIMVWDGFAFVYETCPEADEGPNE